MALGSARDAVKVSWQRADDEGKSKTASLALRVKRLTTRAAKHLHIARDSNVTRRPSPLIEGLKLSVLASTPFTFALTSITAPVSVSFR